MAVTFDEKMLRSVKINFFFYQLFPPVKRQISDSITSTFTSQTAIPILLYEARTGSITKQPLHLVVSESFPNYLRTIYKLYYKNQL